MTRNDTDRPTIMLVNDTGKNALMKQSLELNGYFVLEATDAHEAVEEAVDYTRRERPDVILLDLLQPQDGFNAVCRIRNGGGLGQVPIVLISNEQEASFYAEVLDAGCSEFVTRPVEFDQLKVLLEGLLPSFAEDRQAKVHSARM
jgi:CheY-like chemotaxis protein